MNGVQALVLCNRTSSQFRALGLVIELYNSINEPTFVETLAITTDVIVEADNYRYNFPSIVKYGGDFQLHLPLLI